MSRPALKPVLGVGFVALLINTAYIAAFASPTIFYMANVLLHLVVGVLLASGFAALAARDSDVRRSTRGAALLFGAAVGTGLYLAIYGNVHDHATVLKAHVVVAAIGVAALLPYAMRVSRTRGGPRAFGIAVQTAAVFALAFPLAVGAYNRRYPLRTDRIVNPLTTPLSMNDEGGGPRSPFFPSSAKTNVGGIIPANFFMDSKTCAGCHPDIYRQWESSVHHFASFNNQFYRKSIEYMQSVVGPQPSKWCAGCHDHAVFFNGRFEKPITDQIDTPEAQAGLACTSCHSITHVDSSMGNGGFTVTYPPLHELATSKNRYIRAADRFLTYLNPEPHRRTFMKPFMRQDASEFCSTCHKVHLDVPVNSYRWFRGFNDYDNWQASGVSGQGARSFYYPPTTSTCVDCHMARLPSGDPGHHADGTIHSHRFATANTAVPFVNHDTLQLKATEDFLKSGFISVDIFAASPEDPDAERTPMVRSASENAPRLSTSLAVGEEGDQAAPALIRDVGQVAAPIDKARPKLAPGSTARIDVVVRTRKIGHFFPGGTVDAMDVWLEMQAHDADGRLVFWSGRVTDSGNGPVEEGAHFYRSYQLDGAGNPIDKRNAWQTRSVLYVRLIPPGAADTAHFRVKIPTNAIGPITFTAKLNYRKFGYYSAFSYAGEPKPGQDPSLITRDHNSAAYSYDPSNIPKNVSGQIKDAIPHLPITVLAEATAAVPLSDGRTPTVWTPVADRADTERWNDWGIGLLLQGDLKGAEYAFRKVTEAAPGFADGWVNVARAVIQEGRNDAARPFIERALKVDPSLDRVYYFKALVQKSDGDYAGALASLRVTAAKYPRDRVVLNQIARIQFLQREYASALESLRRVALVDPEDLQMHYTAMLCYQGLGRADDAAREEKLFQRFKADESSQALTGARRLVKPEENNERQQIHEHQSVALDSPPSARKPRAAGNTPQGDAHVGGERQ